MFNHLLYAGSFVCFFVLLSLWIIFVQNVNKVFKHLSSETSRLFTKSIRRLVRLLVFGVKAEVGGGGEWQPSFDWTKEKRY